MLQNNLLAMATTFALALLWLRLNNWAAQRGWVSSDLSRKLVHIGTGPIFVLCWLLFTGDPNARYLAALVPGLITVQFILVGRGLIRDQAAVRSMSRSGDRREILRGPLIYGLVFILITMVYWRDTPIGITALMLMCGGDGLADIVGRRYPGGRLPWNSHKSWAGSLAMFAGGWICSVAVLAIFSVSGSFSTSLTGLLPGLTLICLVGSAVESLPLHDVDNFTVTAAALILGHWLFS